jgi:phosphate transport system protein
MKHTEKELLALRGEVAEMWNLVLSQFGKARQAYINDDLAVAREIASRERRVNSYELKIESDCENFIALYSPVAVDLRLVLSLIRIGITLERIGDFADGVARHVLSKDGISGCERLKADLKIDLMFETVTGMLSESFLALDGEDAGLPGKILSMDVTVDEIYHGATSIISEAIRGGEITAEQGLSTMLVIRKIERAGDHCGNIVEDIVFYTDAKVLRHSGDT